jgi:hypothetical protein
MDRRAFPSNKLRYGGSDDEQRATVAKTLAANDRTDALRGNSHLCGDNQDSVGLSLSG